MSDDTTTTNQDSLEAQKTLMVLGKNSGAEIDFEECVPYRYNTELVEAVRPTLKYCAMILLIFSIILDMLACKWRQCADWIIYFEGINTFITM